MRKPVYFQFDEYVLRLLPVGTVSCRPLGRRKMSVELLVTWILFVCSLYAQQPEIRVVGLPQEEPSELIAKSIVDANQNVCAGLIVFSDLTSLSFNSASGIVKRNSTDGKDFLFLSPDERMVEIFCPGFTTLKLMLNDLGVRLKSGRTWSITITGQKMLEMIPVNFILDPLDAEVIIDGKNVGSGTTRMVKAGTHVIKAVREGFKPFNKSVDISVSNNLINITLQKQDMVMVKIKSVPTGAKILVNDAAKGETDKTMFLYPGEYTIRYSKKRYVDAEKKITVTNDGENIFAVALENNSCSLQLSVQPAGTRVMINGEDFSGKEWVDVSAGRFVIILQKDGYNELTDTLDVGRGQTVKKEYALRPKTGVLHLTVDPANAKIQLLWNKSELIPVAGGEIRETVPVGNYDIIVSAEGYASVQKSFIVTENEKVEEDIELDTKIAEVINNAAGTFVLVKGGAFSLGVNSGPLDEEPNHWVILSDFYIGRYELTQKIWRDVMGVNPSKFVGDDFPVETVSWNSVREFIQKINEREGKDVYRLPTEAEWEYASRGGNLSKGYPFSGSTTLDDVAWYADNSGEKTHRVGTKKPNELGLYDMSGNVREWCMDWYGKTYYRFSPLKDPTGPTGGDFRILRGGAWSSNKDPNRSACRFFLDSNYGFDFDGFRLVMKP